MAPEKVLIVKIGYSEVLDRQGNSRKTSLGDVLRTTTLLNHYKGHDVSWVTDTEAFPLLEGNPLIKRILPYDITTVFQLKKEQFDTVINLEKIPGICAWTDDINARTRFGFRFDARTEKAEAYDKAFEILSISSSEHAKKGNHRPMQDLLFEMVGAKWKEEEYILGYKPKTTEKFDVALNTQVGSKWPTKAWPSESWDKFVALLRKKGYSVTRQDKQKEGVLSNLYSYMDWINSARTIVTSDSLGLHLGLAMGKSVFGLFGPTPASEVYFYNQGEAIVPERNMSCLACFQNTCDKRKTCMDSISPEYVLQRIKKYGAL